MTRRIILIWVALLMGVSEIWGQSVKQPNVSGQFYPSDPRLLAQQIDQYLQAAQGNSAQKSGGIIIVPHAGYRYSGAVAAYGYQAVRHVFYKTIIVLAPSHFFPFNKVSVWSDGHFVTPLGNVEVDQDFAQKLLLEDADFVFEPQVFEKEHALEVQIPFLQRVFTDFRIVPVVTGQLGLDRCRELANALNKLIGERKDVLVVASSDMSHYHDDAFARNMDRLTIQTIEAMDAKKLWQACRVGTMEMCGFVPVTVAIMLAQERGLTGVEVLRYANSGDVTGDKQRVVGYTAIDFFKPSDNPQNENTQEPSATMHKSRPAQGVKPLTSQQKKELLRIAEETIQTYVRTGETKVFRVTDTRLLEPEGVFVTIHNNGSLRGCIGHIVTRAPLYETVREMAIAAASNDPRFPPVKEGELADIDIEISVLSRPERVNDPQTIIPGVHGVIVKRGFQQGVFLPQVATEQGWGREEFLRNLCVQKAGLPADAWRDPRTHLESFTADVFSQKDIEEHP
jgi:AmmeMemoRadiSam system protein B/AmmeMemoRadiSam system protein A